MSEETKKTDEAKEQEAVVSEKKEEIPETVGQMLRRVRLEKQADIRDIATYLCIRAQFLEDIENGEVKNLPGETYASGFVRSYASYLGLDANEIDARHKAEQDQIKSDKRKRMMEEPEMETMSPNKKIIVIAVLMLVVFYGVWSAYTHRSDLPEKENVEQNDTFEPQNPYPLDNIVTTNDVYVETKDLPAEDEEKKAENIPADTVLEKNQTETSVVPVDTVNVQTVSQEQVSSPVSKEQKEPEIQEKPVVRTPRFFGAKNVDGRIVLEAVDETWIEVYQQADDEKTVLLSRLLYKGDKYRLPVGKNIYLRTGNAGGFKVIVDGREVPALGPKGSTRTNILMDADEFLEKLDEE